MSTEPVPSHVSTKQPPRTRGDGAAWCCAESPVTSGTSHAMNAMNWPAAKIRGAGRDQPAPLILPYGLDMKCFVPIPRMPWSSRGCEWDDPRVVGSVGYSLGVLRCGSRRASR